MLVVTKIQRPTGKTLKTITEISAKPKRVVQVGSPNGKTITWCFYNEMSFMCRFVYSRALVLGILYRRNNIDMSNVCNNENIMQKK